MSRPRQHRKLIIFASLFVLLLLLVPGGSLLYEGGGGESCTRCHEIRPSYDMWSVSAHRKLDCEECHGGFLTADIHFHTANLRRLVRHWTGDVPSQVLLVEQPDIERITARCQECHRDQYAAWQAGPHSATYTEIFLDEEHNTKRLLIDDCLRCHGMHFQGSISDLVQPVATKGPWTLKPGQLAGKPVIPCLTCHEIHRRGEPRAPRDPQAPPALDTEPIMPSSLALFDRRTQTHIKASDMPVPAVFEGERRILVSPDQRQALCYQCHAPRANEQAGSGDDRTALGIHEGISCLACHAGHAMETLASCATCHPRYSNCGMSLEKMVSYFKDPNSKFDPHTIKCADCHPKGVPPRRNGLRPVRAD